MGAHTSVLYSPEAGSQGHAGSGGQAGKGSPVPVPPGYLGEAGKGSEGTSPGALADTQ